MDLTLNDVCLLKM